MWPTPVLPAAIAGASSQPVQQRCCGPEYTDACRIPSAVGADEEFEARFGAADEAVEGRGVAELDLHGG